MKTKKQLCNLHFGNKGVIFMLDIIIAVMIATILISVSYYYIIKSEEDITPNLQMVRTGSDIITSLDNQNLILPEIYKWQVENEIEKLLPPNYGIKIEIDHECECGKQMSGFLCKILKLFKICKNTYSMGDNPPNDKFIATGKRYFTRRKTIEWGGYVFVDIFYYGSIKYWIWLK